MSWKESSGAWHHNVRAPWSGLGLLFAVHGAQKLLGVLGGQQVPIMSQFGLAGVIELVGGLMIAAGVFASLAAFVASGEMAVAYS